MQVGRAIRTERWKYSVVAEGLDGFEYPASNQYTEEFLYDLKSDGYELTNLAGFESHQEVAKVLRQRLVDSMVEAGERSPEITAAPKRKSPVHGRVVSVEEAWQ